MKGSNLFRRQIDVSIGSGYRAYQSIHDIFMILSLFLSVHINASRFDDCPLGQSLVVQNKLLILLG